MIAKSETPRPLRCLTVHPWHDLQPLCFFCFVISDHGVRGLVSIGRTRSCYWTLLLVFSPPRLHVHGIRNEAKREEKADRMRAGCMGTVLPRARGMKNKLKYNKTKHLGTETEAEKEGCSHEASRGRASQHGEPPVAAVRVRPGMHSAASQPVLFQRLPHCTFLVVCLLVPVYKCGGWFRFEWMSLVCWP